jgi:hypothetical protein
MSDVQHIAKHVPKNGSKAYLLLGALLEGVRVDPIYATAQLNLLTVNARVSELRKLGWPIRTISVPHPKFRRETMPSYYLDAHFRAWMTENPGQHPGAYPDTDGRGKFDTWTEDDFKRGNREGEE